jgi:hypothetical protein
MNFPVFCVAKINEKTLEDENNFIELGEYDTVSIPSKPTPIKKALKQKFFFLTYFF